MPVTMKMRKSAHNRRPARAGAIAANRRTQMVARRVMGGISRPLPGQLRGQLGPELKALDVPAANYTLNTTAQITPLNLIRTGSTFCNRIGRKIEMQSVRVSGRLNTANTVADEDYFRMMIIYDRQTNGALPAIADILQTTDQATANSTTSQSGINLNNRDRFIILRDLRIVPPSLTSTAGVVTNLGITDPISRLSNFDFFVKLKGLLTQYKADSAPAVIGDIASGGLYLVTYGGKASGSEGFSCILESRLRYLDA